MLHIDIVAVGKLKERFWTEACNEYLKRLKSYAQVNVIEIADIDPSTSGGVEAALAKEGAAILKAIPNDSHVILLDIQGKQLSSEGIASRLDELALEGTSAVTFVIGGSTGVDAEVKALAKERWSFGKITMPHNLARVVLIEQIYRAFKIIKREPYHK